MAEDTIDLDELGGPDGVYFTKPTTQIDLERRQALEDNPNAEAEKVNETPYAVEGNDTSGYVGVSSEYMTYADETHAPLIGEGGAELRAEEKILNGGDDPQLNKDDDEDDEEKEEVENTTTPSAPAAPVAGQSTTPSTTTVVPTASTSAS